MSNRREKNDALLRGGPFRSADRRKLVDPSVCHQSHKEMTILQCVAPHELPVLNDAIVERAGRALRASERERAELELARSRRFPRSAPTVAVDPRACTTVSLEGDRVLRRVVGGQHPAVAALKLDELPRRAAQVGNCVVRRRAHAAGDGQQKRRQQQKI